MTPALASSSQATPSIDPRLFSEDSGYGHADDAQHEDAIVSHEWASVDGKTALPGFDLPLNFYLATSPRAGPEDRPFPNALHPADMNQRHSALLLTTIREFKMLRIMNQITDKPEWDEKVTRPFVVHRWTQEVLATEDADVEQKMMDWVFAELRYKARVFHETGVVSVYTGDVIKCDTALNESFKHELQAAVKPLEDVPEREQDWHPGSDDKVLDLVHPSLFPLVYGRSKILESGRTILEDCAEMCGQGVVIPLPPEEEKTMYLYTEKHAYSRNFQWLPCEVDISTNKARITSYINNLHPAKYKALYRLIEQAIDAAIPLWNATLAPTLAEWRTRINYRQSNRIVRPEPGQFWPPVDPPRLDLRRKFKTKGLQVIVKLANIHLTPENPRYDGGSWHVEGQLNEHICATALYYYSSENITESELAFRQQSDTTDAHSIYTRDDDRLLKVIYGCKSDGPGTQLVGTVKTNEGRLLTFPNILQHRVQPFELQDPTKPGHRKILALFLIDPHFRVISTAKVPPQQKDWWVERLEKEHTLLDTLPRELKDAVFGEVKDSFPIDLKEAKEFREKLMEERKAFQVRHNDAFNFTTEFSLCEH
ncbi:unnamed protein product [Cyclocybe aegerita]|uniref:Uncharacterized protein n=1 Tax=Cyclocybe aegerita TaxID=1973307 RepID=A0A8S0WR47_CYCAE|nr:unnamed protein product [Cyclocybe aegerita]